jgi:putative oxidoreductase
VVWVWFSFITGIRNSLEIRKGSSSLFRPLVLPGHFVYVAGVIEVFGGLAIIFGLLTPVVGIILLLEMAVAMWKYNFNEGIYAVREYELPLILGLASLSLVATGAGALSLDYLIFGRADKHKAR